MHQPRAEGPPVGSVDDLVAAFHRAGKPRERWRIGVEHEKHGVLVPTGRPAPYAGTIEPLLSDLGGAGWQPVREGEQLVGLVCDSGSISLEPGGQLELAGPPRATQAEIREDLARHLEALEVPSRRLQLAWLGVGFRPFGTLEDVPWVPKARYAVMREYLPTRGRLAHEMMKRTATTQANLDFADEADAQRKVRAAMSATSVVTALFASSPIVDGRAAGFQSYRAQVWLETDPDRCGLLPFVFENRPLFRAYTEWALDVPLFFVYRDGRYHPAGGMTFRRFLADGFGGERATMADWELHLSTLFPEVRLKGFLEVRGADVGPAAMILALPALWEGLLYDDASCEETTRLFGHLTFAQREAVRRDVPRKGLATEIPGLGTVRDAARELLALARAGLGRRDPAGPAGLEPLEEIVATGRTTADRIVDLWREGGGEPARLIEGLRL